MRHLSYALIAALVLISAVVSTTQANETTPLEETLSNVVNGEAPTPEATAKIEKDPAPAIDEDCLNLPNIVLAETKIQHTTECQMDGRRAVIMLGDEHAPIELKDGQLSITIEPKNSGTLPVTFSVDGATVAQESMIVLNGVWSLLPALLAIVTALIFRQVIPALFLGIWSGAWIIRGMEVEALWFSLLDVIDTYLLEALVPADGSNEHMAIALFTMLTGGMIGIISRNGGMGGIVNAMTRYANTPRKGQVATGVLGLSVFFDDYANSLIVGNTMRPLIDKLRISREKLAYLVDSTAAPIACIAMVTTWIGFQLSLVNQAVGTLDGFEMSPYQLMINAIPYSFYPILTLIFIAMLIITGRDFGPMYEAERAARKKVPVEEDKKDKNVYLSTGHSYLALVPILVLLITTIAGLIITGEGDSIRDVFGSADPFRAIMWASMLSLLTAGVLSVISGQLTTEETVDAMQKGFHPMLLAVVILTFAWAIADVNKALHTAEYIISMIGDRVNPALLPAMVFLIASVTAFATGASWGTMGILVPLVIPLGWSAMQHHGLVDAQHMHILYATLASVLAGAVWGDHCSPISDTTILSSISSGCDHIAHVRTQMPYAMTVAIVAMFTSVLPVGYGMSWWLGLALGSAVLLFILRSIGKHIPDYV